MADSFKDIQSRLDAAFAPYKNGTYEGSLEDVYNRARYGGSSNSAKASNLSESRSAKLARFGEQDQGANLSNSFSNIGNGLVESNHNKIWNSASGAELQKAFSDAANKSLIRDENGTVRNLDGSVYTGETERLYMYGVKGDPNAVKFGTAAGILPKSDYRYQPGRAQADGYMSPSKKGYGWDPGEAGVDTSKNYMDMLLPKETAIALEAMVHGNKNALDARKYKDVMSDEARKLSGSSEIYNNANFLGDTSKTNMSKVNSNLSSYEKLVPASTYIEDEALRMKKAAAASDGFLGNLVDSAQYGVGKFVTNVADTAMDATAKLARTMGIDTSKFKGFDKQGTFVGLDKYKDPLTYGFDDKLTQNAVASVNKAVKSGKASDVFHAMFDSLKAGPEVFVSSLPDMFAAATGWGTALYAATAMNRTLDDRAEAKGGADKLTMEDYILSAGSGSAQALTNRLTGGNVGVKEVKDMAKSFVAIARETGGKTAIMHGLGSVLKSMGEEGIEEGIQNTIQEVAGKVGTAKQNEIGDEKFWTNILSGVALGAAAGGVGHVSMSAKRNATELIKGSPIVEGTPEYYDQMFADVKTTKDVDVLNAKYDADIEAYTEQNTILASAKESIDKAQTVEELVAAASSSALLSNAIDNNKDLQNEIHAARTEAETNGDTTAEKFNSLQNKFNTFIDDVYNQTDTAITKLSAAQTELRSRLEDGSMNVSTVNVFDPNETLTKLDSVDADLGSDINAIFGNSDNTVEAVSTLISNTENIVSNADNNIKTNGTNQAVDSIVDIISNTENTSEALAKINDIITTYENTATEENTAIVDNPITAIKQTLVNATTAPENAPDETVNNNATVSTDNIGTIDNTTLLSQISSIVQNSIANRKSNNDVILSVAKDALLSDAKTDTAKKDIAALSSVADVQNYLNTIDFAHFNSFSKATESDKGLANTTPSANKLAKIASWLYSPTKNKASTSLKEKLSGLTNSQLDLFSQNKSQAVTTLANTILNAEGVSPLSAGKIEKILTEEINKRVKSGAIKGTAVPMEIKTDYAKDKVDAENFMGIMKEIRDVVRPAVNSVFEAPENTNVAVKGKIPFKEPLTIFGKTVTTPAEAAQVTSDVFFDYLNKAPLLRLEALQNLSDEMKGSLAVELYGQRMTDNNKQLLVDKFDKEIGKQIKTRFHGGSKNLTVMRSNVFESIMNQPITTESQAKDLAHMLKVLHETDGGLAHDKATSKKVYDKMVSKLRTRVIKERKVMKDNKAKAEQAFKDAYKSFMESTTVPEEVKESVAKMDKEQQAEVLKSNTYTESDAQEVLSQFMEIIDNQIMDDNFIKDFKQKIQEHLSSLANCE